MSAINFTDPIALNFALLFLYFFGSILIYTTGVLHKSQFMQWISAGLALSAFSIVISFLDTPHASTVAAPFLFGTGQTLISYGLLKFLTVQIHYKIASILTSIFIGAIVLSGFTGFYNESLYPLLTFGFFLVTAGYVFSARSSSKGKRSNSYDRSLDRSYDRSYDRCSSTIASASSSRSFTHKCILLLTVLHVAFAVLYLNGFALHFEPIPVNLLVALGAKYKVIILTLLEMTRLLMVYVMCTVTCQHQTSEKMRLLQRLTFTDPLTGVHNKRSATHVLAAEKERIKRYNSKCCVAIVDLDHFKQVNDTYGHPFGDTVLKTFARICREQLRSFDTIARYGGEEFLLILPETDLYQGMLIADRVRKTLSAYTWQGVPLKQTICVGVIEVNSQNCSKSTESLIERADAALYVAKKNGRNHVEAAAYEAV